MILLFFGFIGFLAGVYGIYKIVKFFCDYNAVATALLDITTDDLEFKYDGKLDGYGFQTKDGTYLLRLFHIAPTGNRHPIAHGIAKNHKVKVCSFDNWALEVMREAAWDNLLEGPEAVEKYNVVKADRVVRQIFRIVELNQDFTDIEVTAHGIADSTGLRLVDSMEWFSNGGGEAIALNGNPKVEVHFLDEEGD